MPLLVWDQSLAVGMPLFDVQHQNLCARLSTLYEAVTQGRSHHIQKRLLTELIRDTVAHFRDEEQLMRAANFAGFAAHVQEHRDLEHKVLDLQLRLQRTEESIGDTTLHFLRDWLVRHVRESDAQLASLEAPAPSSPGGNAQP